MIVCNDIPFEVVHFAAIPHNYLPFLAKLFGDRDLYKLTSNHNIPLFDN